MVASILGGLGTSPSLADQARCAGLMGAILRDLAAMKFEPKDMRYAALLERVMVIFDREKSKMIPIRDAIAAAEALGQAGDPRFEKPARAGNWVKIDACDFRLGETKRTVQPGDFAIGRYPVTVQEYAEFIEAGGYTNAQGWETGGHGKWQQPEGWEDQIAHPNRPVVGVSWFEASAYAKWSGCRLPDEAEWERAAAGREDREYPWGAAEPNERLANWRQNVGAPTSVGVYPCGATPDGVADMAGNVWEWCENWYSEGTKQYRVLRGGSGGFGFPDDLRSCRLISLPPGVRREFVGFRVVCGVVSAR
jgi:formylglycine-generating enzyme required for sulfatase activity